MQYLVVLFLFLGQASASIHFDAARAWEHLRRVVAIGPRPAGSAAIEESRRYIKTTLASAGVSVAEQAWTDRTPLGPVRLVNLIATIPGASTNRLMIAGHYDTKLVREFRFVGANDGGSSTAFLLELARVLKARRNALTIELVFFDGEEAFVEWAGTDNTYGSRHYVSVAKQNGSLATLKAMILVDMIADRDLRIMRESHSTPWLADIIWDAARREKLGQYFDAEGMPIEDDHLPFLEAGVPAVDLIDFEFKAWHTAADTLDAVSSRGLQVVGDTLLAALPAIEARLR
jgi:Zn-dependent M28 family amino/carboxypeptidase